MHQLQLWCAVEGYPGTVQADNGNEFSNADFTKFFTDLGINVIHSRVCHPQTNGKVERLNRTLKQMIFDKANGTGIELTYWPDLLFQVTCTYNAQNLDGETFSPFEAFTGRKKYSKASIIQSSSPKAAKSDRYVFDELEKSRKRKRAEVTEYLGRRAEKILNARSGPEGPKEQISIGSILSLELSDMKHYVPSRLRYMIVKVYEITPKGLFNVFIGNGAALSEAIHKSRVTVCEDECWCASWKKNVDESIKKLGVNSAVKVYCDLPDALV